MNETERLFIGVPVDESTRSILMRQLPKNLPGKAAPPENWHFTLRFLGSTEAGRRDELIERLSSTRFGSSFDLAFDRLGAFPNPGRARVVWIGTGAGHERLERIAARVEEICRAVGFEPEKRTFKAHLTIARMREPQSVAALLSSARPIQATVEVREISLYRSESGIKHSRYSIVASIPLD
jgi:2'-5' RNA ligase